MTYEKAINVLREYNHWRNRDKGHRIPRHEDVTDAIVTAIDTMQCVLDGRVISNPQEVRLDALTKMMEDFVKDNR